MFCLEISSFFFRTLLVLWENKIILRLHWFEGLLVTLFSWNEKNRTDTLHIVSLLFTKTKISVASHHWQVTISLVSGNKLKVSQNVLITTTLSWSRYKLSVCVCSCVCFCLCLQFSVGDEVFPRNAWDLSTETEWEVRIMSETTFEFSLWLNF